MVEVLGERRRRRVPRRRVLLETFQANQLELSGNARPYPARPRWLPLQYLNQGIQRRLADERRPAREQLVEDCAEAVDVTERTNRTGSPGCLLRRHVAGGADDRPGSRDASFRLQHFG